MEWNCHSRITRRGLSAFFGWTGDHAGRAFSYARRPARGACGAENHVAGVWVCPMFDRPQPRVPWSTKSLMFAGARARPPYRLLCQGFAASRLRWPSRSDRGRPDEKSAADPANRACEKKDPGARAQDLQPPTGGGSPESTLVHERVPIWLRDRADARVLFRRRPLTLIRQPGQNLTEQGAARPLAARRWGSRPRPQGGHDCLFRPKDPKYHDHRVHTDLDWPVKYCRKLHSR